MEQCKMAGWTTLPEQLVHRNPSSALPGSLSRHRCDLLAIQPSGKTLAIEIVVTAISRIAKVQQSMFSLWREKARRYAAYIAKDELPRDEDLLTFVVSGWGGMSRRGSSSSSLGLNRQLRHWVLRYQRLWLHRAQVVAAVQRACVVEGTVAHVVAEQCAAMLF